MTSLLSPDEYMAVLRDRALAEGCRLGAPPPLEWMVREGDDELVDMAAVEATLARWERADKQPTPARKPRTYRPASHWRDKLARVEAALARETASDRPDDRAAYTGIGIRETGRQRVKRHAATDRSLERTARLMRERETLRHKLARAEAREAS